MVRLLVRLLVVVAAVALAGCDGGDGGGERREHSGGAPPGLELTFIQTRSLEGTDRAQVRVTNRTGGDVDVATVGVDWPGFPGEPQAFPYLVRDGRTLDLPYTLPDPDCRASAARAPAYALAASADASWREPMDPAGMRSLTRLWHTACDEQRIARVVTFAWGDAWVGEGRGESSVLHGRLLLTRGPRDVGVRVVQVKGSVLFALDLPAADRLPTGVDGAALPLDVRRGRCDEHGRRQSAQTFVWRVFVRWGAHPAVSHIVPLTGTQQARLQRFLDRACASHVGMGS